MTRAFIKTCLLRPIAWQPVWRQALQELLRVLPRRPVLLQELPSRQEQQAWLEQPLLYRQVQQVLQRGQFLSCPQEQQAWLRP